MSSLKDKLANLPAATIEVVSSQATQGPTLEGISLGQGFATVADPTGDAILPNPGDCGCYCSPYCCRCKT